MRTESGTILEGQTLSKLSLDLEAFIQGERIGYHAMTDTKIDWSSIINAVPSARGKDKAIDATAVLSYLEKDLAKFVKEDKAARVVLAKTASVLHAIFDEAKTNKLSGEKLEMYYTMKMGGNLITESEKYASTLKTFLSDDHQSAFSDTGGPPMGRKIVRLEDADGNATGESEEDWRKKGGGGPKDKDYEFSRFTRGTCADLGIDVDDPRIERMKKELTQPFTLSAAKEWLQKHGK